MSLAYEPSSEPIHISVVWGLVLTAALSRQLMGEIAAISGGASLAVHRGPSQVSSLKSRETVRFESLISREAVRFESLIPRETVRFESLILSHHSRVTCECNKEDINDDDDDGWWQTGMGDHVEACDIPYSVSDNATNLISHKEFLQSFCRSQLPHKSVNLSFTITNINNKLTDLCGN